MNLPLEVREMVRRMEQSTQSEIEVWVLKKVV